MAVYQAASSRFWEIPSHPLVKLLSFVAVFSLLGSFAFAIFAPEEMADLKKELIAAALRFGGIVAMIGGVFGYRSNSRIATWSRTRGLIVKSELTTDFTSPRDGTRIELFRPDIAYRYAVDGREHESDRIEVSRLSSSDRAKAEATCARYPVGLEIDLSYNPRAEEQSIIEFDPKAVKTILFVSFGMGLGLIAFSFILFI